QQAARRRGRYSSLHERSLTTASRCIRDNFDWLQRSYRSEAQTIASGAIPWADGKLVHDRLGATGRMAGTSQYFAASNDTRAHGALSPAHAVNRRGGTHCGAAHARGWKPHKPDETQARQGGHAQRMAK